MSSLVLIVETILLGATTTPLEGTAPQFVLKDYLGTEYRMADFQQPIVVMAFLGTECPLAKLYGPRLQSLADEYRERGVAVIGVNSNSQDSISDIAAYAKAHKLSFPILKDVGNSLADALQAQRTPEVFVLDADRRIRYQGRIDDQYGVGVARAKPTREDLRSAIDELLAGQPVSHPKYDAVGCIIGRVRAPQADSSVTYCNQIARIFQKHCVECHRDGEIAPFSLNSYEEVAGWAETIGEVVRGGRMPPWHADPSYGTFANARALTGDEKESIYRWVAAGAPQGDPAQLPNERKFVPGWRLPKEPDQTIAMSDDPFSVPATGVVEYQYFKVDPGFTTDKWISATEVIPGNRSVVHHAVVFIQRPDRSDKDELDWIAAYVPGHSMTSLPVGHAYRVPAGSKFVFQMHYTPNGSPQHDVTKLGLIFADPAEVTNKVMTLLAMNRRFEIPPRAESHSVLASIGPFPKGARLLAMAPHMHLRGKSFRISAKSGGQETVLLNVPRYDFNWQHSYIMAEPKDLEGVRLNCVAEFDNSINNPVNPNPDATVRWGEQTWEEMAIAYFAVAVPVNQPLDKSPPARPESAAANGAEKNVGATSSGDGKS
jgi:peroxiredoxin